jgi:hypothetical protein
MLPLLIYYLPKLGKKRHFWRVIILLDAKTGQKSSVLAGNIRHTQYIEDVTVKEAPPMIRLW